MTNKNYIRLRAKSLNTHGYYRIAFFLLISIGLYFFISNFQELLNLAVNFFDLKSSFLNYNSFLIPCALIVFISTFFLLSILKSLREGWFISKIKNKNIKFKNVFKMIKEAGILRSLCLYLWLAVLRIMWVIVFFVPTVFYLKVSLSLFKGYEATPFAAIVLLAGFVLIFLIGLTSFLCLIQKYFLCYYLLLNNLELRLKDVIYQSQNLCEGKLLKILLFKLKFIPSFLLCVFIFPVFRVYTFYKQSCALFANELFKNRNKAEDQTLTFEKVS